jgi:predicted dehydrogenase
MGSAYQTARKLIDDGMIGVPLFAQSFCYRSYNMFQRAGEPEDVTKSHMAPGSTITYDMAGYYINALVSLLGPVRRVSGFSRFFDEREYTNPRHPKYKQPVVKTGNTISMGSFEFENGCYANMVMCQDGFGPEIPRVEIYGTEGVLYCADPNNFGGWWGNDVYLSRIGNPEKFKMPFTHGFGDIGPDFVSLTGKPEACAGSWRGVAVVDMAWAIRRNRPHRSSAELALHGVEIMDAIERSNDDNKVHILESRPERPAPLAAGCFGISAEASIDNI